MDGKTLADFCSLLQNMPSSKDTPWQKSAILMYQLGLARIPNESFKRLAECVLLRCKFRPSCAEIVELYHEISDTRTEMPATEALARTLKLVKKYGEYGALNPMIPSGNGRLPGEPPELAQAPQAVRDTIDAFGGWVAMCREDCEPMVFRAQFERMYKAACAGAGNSDIREIRRQYQIEQAQVPMLEGASQ